MKYLDQNICFVFVEFIKLQCADKTLLQSNTFYVVQMAHLSIFY